MANVVSISAGLIGGAPTTLYGTNTADVVANAVDTYITAVALPISGKIKAGTFFRYRFGMTKTAAGIAAPTWIVRVGTAGTTADAARLTFTGLAQTAAIDTGWVDLEVQVRNAGSSGIIQGVHVLVHNLTTTGFANAAQPRTLQVVSGAFDLTLPNLILGVSINPGASGVWTHQITSVSANNLAS